MSPNHTDLIRQITNWQVALLADLPINARNEAAASLRPNPGRDRRAPGSLWDSALTTGSGAGEPPGVPAQTSWHQGLLAQLCLAPRPSHLEPQKRTGSLGFCQVPARLRSHCRGPAGSTRDRQSGGSPGTAANVAGLEKRTLTDLLGVAH